MNKPTCNKEIEENETEIPDFLLNVNSVREAEYIWGIESGEIIEGKD